MTIPSAPRPSSIALGDGLTPARWEKLGIGRYSLRRWHSAARSERDQMIEDRWQRGDASHPLSLTLSACWKKEPWLPGQGQGGTTPIAPATIRTEPKVRLTAFAISCGRKSPGSTA